jgi:hypothetical protein
MTDKVLVDIMIVLIFQNNDYKTLLITISFPTTIAPTTIDYGITPMFLTISSATTRTFM